MPERGLDDRAVDEDGRIREKNGSAKMGNLAKTYCLLPADAIFGVETSRQLSHKRQCATPSRLPPTTSSGSSRLVALRACTKM
jgi:hypothetical protein